jgi:hypothetical protein
MRWAEPDRFAAWLMENVRDEAIDTSDRCVDDERLKAIVPQVVDAMLFRLVHYAENGSDLGWRPETARWVSFDDPWRR